MTENEAWDNPVLPQGPPAVPDQDREERTHVRERILRRFELWLDEILDSEQPPEGVAAEILAQLQTDASAEPLGEDQTGCDAYAMWSALTAMAEETRLQGRAFKQLHESLTPMQEAVGSVDAMLRRYEAALDQQEQKTAEAARQAAWSDVLGTLIDMRDRLLRGSQSAEAWLQRPGRERAPGFAAGILARFQSRRDEDRIQQQEEAVRSMLKGYSLCQEVLEEALARAGVRPIDCLGRPFDPLTMKAVDIGYGLDVPEGAVLEVYRPGYWRGETVYRPAEVKVAKRRQGAGQDQGEAQTPAALPGEQHGSQ